MISMDISCFWRFILLSRLPIFDEVIQRRVMKSHWLSSDGLSPTHRLSNLNKTKALASIQGHFSLNFSIWNFNLVKAQWALVSQNFFTADDEIFSFQAFMFDINQNLFPRWPHWMSSWLFSCCIIRALKRQKFKFPLIDSKEWKSIPLSSLDPFLEI